jgi:hypothetical protein
MIEIKQTPDSNIIVKSSVSDFCSSMGFCEIRIKHFLEGVKPPQTQITIDGTVSHEKEEIYEKEHFKLEPVTTQELGDLTKNIEFSREGIFTRFLKDLSFEGEKLSLLIYGRADKIMRSNGTLIVEDSKFPSTKDKYQTKFEPYDDQKLQILLYLNSTYSENGTLEEKGCFKINCDNKAWIINIKDKATMESIKTFQGYQTKEAEEFLNQKINRFALLALGKLKPEHHKNVRKCKSCRFQNCHYSIK